MDMCLLCLELKNESSNGIKVTSPQWEQENIEYLIEKHFWTLKSISSSSWLCANCWQALNEFHKFYIRIEDAHMYFGSMLKIELVESNEDIESIAFNDLSTNIKSSQSDEDKPLVVKSEIINEEQLIPAEVVDSSQKTRLKRRDPLEKRPSAKSRKKIKEETPIEEEENSQDLEGDVTNVEPNKAANNKSLDKNNETDGDEKPIKTEVKLRTNPYYKPRTNRHELDEFLAKNYSITCVICKAPAQTFHELCKHFAKQHNERAYVICCNKKFIQRSVLVDHVHRHLDPDYFKCKHCGVVMPDSRCLEFHVRIHETQDKTPICDICGKAFSRPSGLRNHKLIHLSDEEKKFGCEQCGKHFGNNNLLQNHIRVVHLNKYALVCDICGKKMRCKESFERHILLHQGVPLPTVSCDVCGLKVTGQRGLKSHKDSQHPEGGKQDYPCHICSHISPTRKALRRHVQCKHEQGYDFKCTICDKAYKRSTSLTEHMATHTGTVLYTCPYCPKTSNSSANMHSHRKKAHPKEWEEACRAKYSGNLPPKYKPAVTNDVQQSNYPMATVKWYEGMQ